MCTAMTPRTRQSNKDQDYKVYYSKKIPQQIYFPHRRKTVRRPDPVAKDGPRGEQTTLLQEKTKLRRVTTICDSEEEDEEDLEDVETVIKSEVNDDEDIEPESRAQARGKKRKSNALEKDNDDRSANPTPKRTRRAAEPNSNRRARHVKIESEDDIITPPPSRRKTNSSHSLRRQSTMTQLVEGRRPASDTEEPT